MSPIAGFRSLFFCFFLSEQVHSVQLTTTRLHHVNSQACQGSVVVF